MPSISGPPAPTARKPMVGWYDPAQLAKTGVEVVISTIFGRHADHRLLEALARKETNEPDADYSVHADGSARTSIWIDYVGDTGDGWDSTYAIAYTIAQPSFAVPGDTGRVNTSRGNILIFGGDQVYPTASRAEYQQRFVAAYETALRSTSEPHPDTFAIPGNHDWYDSLVSYTRLFCSGRWLGGWRTRQSASYFALKLPHGWWLLGTDVQLGSDIDLAQVDFFRRIAMTHMAPDDRVILCHAEPNWIAAAAYGKQEADAEQSKLSRWIASIVYGKNDPDASEHNLMYLEDRILGHRVRVFLAGDLHHYRRHAAADGTQKITCGGGGAFLHPTHGPNVETIHERGLDGAVRRSFKREHAYPDERTSRRLAWGNLAFLFRNPKLGLVAGILYALLGWAVVGPLPDPGGGLRSAFAIIVNELAWRPGMVLMLVGLVFALVLFTDTHSPLHRWVGGGLHGVAHLTAMFVLGWAGANLLGGLIGRRLGTVIVMGVGGYFVAPLLLGIYLLVSLNVFRRHSNEAFSSLRIPDWKSFLRMHIAENGTLTIYPIGIDRVPRSWKAAPGGGHPDTSELVPDDGDATPPRLIEAPVRVSR